MIHNLIMFCAGGLATVMLFVVGRWLVNRWIRWRANVREAWHWKVQTERRVDWLEKESARQCKAHNHLADQSEHTKKRVAALECREQPHVQVGDLPSGDKPAS